MLQMIVVKTFCSPMYMIPCAKPGMEPPAVRTADAGLNLQGMTCLVQHCRKLAACQVYIVAAHRLGAVVIDEIETEIQVFVC